MKMKYLSAALVLVSSLFFTSCDKDNPADVNIPPLEPSNLTIGDVSNNSVDLSWVDNSEDEEGFVIEQKDESEWGEIHRTIADVTEWTHQNLNEYTWQHYRVNAFNEFGDSQSADPDSIRTMISAPDNLTASTISPTQIDLEWQDNSNLENGYSIERSMIADGQWQVIELTASDVNTFSDQSLENSTEYTYRLRSRLDDEFSEYSDEVTAVTQDAPLIVLDTDSLSIDYNSNGTQITMTNGGGGTINWLVEINEDASDWLTLADLDLTKNNGSFMLEVAENPQNARLGEIVVSATDAEISPLSITVYQGDHPPVLNISDPDIGLSYDSEGESFTVQNLGGGLMEWTITEEVEWLTIDPMSGTNETEISINCLINNSDDRQAEVTISAPGSTPESSSIIIAQFGRPILAVSPDGIEISYTDSSAVFEIQNIGSGQMDWGITEDMDWMDVDIISGVNDQTINIKCGVNEDIERQGEIIITAPDSETSSISIMITQTSGKPILEVDVESLAVSRFSRRTSFNVLNTGGGELNWVATTHSFWLTITPEAGINNGEISIVTLSSQGVEAREGEITITGVNSEPEEIVISVRQDSRYGGVESIEPDEADQGDNLEVTISGRDADFRFLTEHGWTILQKDETEIHGRMSRINRTTLNVNFSIPNDAETGLWNLNMGSNLVNDIIITPDAITINPR